MRVCYFLASLSVGVGPVSFLEMVMHAGSVYCLARIFSDPRNVFVEQWVNGCAQGYGYKAHFGMAMKPKDAVRPDCSTSVALWTHLAFVS